MTNIFRKKKQWIITFCIMLFSSVCFSQDLSDQEIGFDIIRETNYLKEWGITDLEDISREIERNRETSRIQYIEMVRGKEEILKRIQSKGLLRSSLTEVISQSEIQALKALYDSTGGSKWKINTGWDFSTPVTSWNKTTKTGWYGITVVNGQVASLSLGENNLTGFIPSEIGQLKFLKFLSLRDNKLSGSIPEEISALINIEMLGLEINNLSGNLPQSIYDLKSLVHLYVQKNKLDGALSLEIGNLTNLINLYVDNNQFIGTIPSEIGQLSKLRFASFTNNQFSGAIPVEIGNLKSLGELYLGNNKLTGSIPPGIGLLKNIRTLNLRYNELSGKIPVELKKNAFYHLYLNNNLLEGKVPDLSIELDLDLSYNKLHFLDLSEQFTSYKAKMRNKFIFSPQARTDTVNTITSAIGGSTTLTMYEDGRFTPDETFQWY
ncbi:hypothetical protein, partial [Flavobacterium sp. AJR]